MSIFNKFFKKDSAKVAKNRLSMMLAIERGENVPYMKEMEDELLGVIKKYTKSGQIRVKADKNQNISVLEIEILLENEPKT